MAFFIRKVPGGSFTGLVDERSLLGQGLSRGPQGEFHLRPSAAPLLMVGGGSGLAPLLAILQGALAGNPGRPATLLFGARQEHDLYALEEIASLAAQWPAPFRFVRCCRRAHRIRAGAAHAAWSPSTSRRCWRRVRTPTCAARPG